MLRQESVGYTVPDTEVTVRGGILGDKMGVGKTIQALGLIANGSGTKTLVVTPLAVRGQWESELKRANVNLYLPTQWGEKWIFQGAKGTLPCPSKKTVHLAHYDKVANKPALCEGEGYDRIVLDEAQTIRNASTKKSLSIFKVPATYRWALTATPIMNQMDDAVTYLKFIGCPIVSGSKKWSDKYEPWAQNLYLSRIQGECKAPPGLIMPPTPLEEVRMLDFTSKDEEKVYKGIFMNEEAQWRKAQALAGGSYTLAMLSILSRLRQVSVNPQIYIKARQKESYGWTGPEFNTVSRKFDEIAYLMREAQEAGESRRWIVFCQFHEEMEMLQVFLNALPFVGQILQYHGGMSMKEREAALKESKVVSEGKQDVFLIQLKAGSTGLNLQHYDRIIFVSPWWTPAEMEQARGRAVRIGQKNVVRIYLLHLNAEDTFNIDKFIMDKVVVKKGLADEFESWSVHRAPEPKEASGNTTPDPEEI
jgi:non-specific serine/threonine protein kinase